MSTRRGFSLIEVVVAMAVGSALMAVAVGTLHLILRAEQTCRERLNHQQMIANLTDQFRGDAHAAQEFSGEPWKFEMGAGRVVEYRHEPESLVRTETVGGQLRKQEQYPLPAGAGVRMSIESQRPRMVAMEITPATAEPLDPEWKRVWVEACLGADGRFARAGGQGGKTP